MLAAIDGVRSPESNLQATPYSGLLHFVFCALPIPQHSNECERCP
jgi:hypothetical protein